ncbi:MAG: hypothetical protein PHE89_05575 [Alphaproteobacteria bacterium]|nr:hypothetical protein [Alphaproteobacteria bacterium]
MGATALTVAAVAAFANQKHTERKTRSAELKSIRRQQAINEAKKKNILEGQLAARRAKVGSLGISTSGSNVAVQNRLVGDAQREISYDNWGYQDKYAQVFNNYQDKIRSEAIDYAPKVYNYVEKMIK